MRRRYLVPFVSAAALGLPLGIFPIVARAVPTAAPVHRDPHDLLAAILRGDHGSYVAARELQSAIEELERRDVPEAPVDLLLLAAGALRGDVRALQEYLRLHGEALPVAVRARMTKPFARKLAEASKRNESQDWMGLRVRLRSDLDSSQGEGCALDVNGRAVGALPTARLEVVPGAPQRLHVRCPNGLRLVSTVVPAASSDGEVEAILSPADARVLAGSPRASGVPGEKKNRDAPLVDAAPEETASSIAGRRRRERLVVGASMLTTGGLAKRHGLHNLSLDDGLFLRAHLGGVGSRFHWGALYGSGRQRRAGARGPQGFMRVQALSLEGGAAWAWHAARSDFGIEVPANVGLWRWFCSRRPCGFHKKDPGVSVGTGLTALIPAAAGLRFELSALPAIVVGARPVPHLEFRTQVSFDE